MDMGIHSHAVDVEGVRVDLNEMPLLHCPQCKAFVLPDHAKRVVAFFVKQAHKASKLQVEVKPTGVKTKRFTLGTVEFAYSALDHDFIPGLARPRNDGFLTPVFFNAAVLNKYTQDPSYRLDLFSDTYGSIIKGDEINIQFGINRAGKVIMWLGDIATLPENEQYYLRSENVDSDHDICSEFYDAQIGCVFSEPSLENRAMHARLNLNERCKEKFGSELYQLHGEISRVIEGLRRPLFWEEKHIAPAAESFNRIMVESLHVTMLRKQLEPHIPKNDLKSLKGLKLLELWLSKGLGAADASALMLPFFVLYDFRILMCHLTSDETQEKSLASINERLGIDPASTRLDLIYFALLPKITASLESILALIP
jgi:hypothetical protein